MPYLTKEYDFRREDLPAYAKKFYQGYLQIENHPVFTHLKGTIYDNRNSPKDTPITKAAQWFLNHYPLLGGIASSFKIIEDYEICQKYEIHIAAVDAGLGEIYANPAAGLSETEWRFVLAHEYLHAGLEHHKRCNGRDTYLWNVACDFVINGWLKEMQIGSMPTDGLLLDIYRKVLHWMNFSKMLCGKG